LPLQSLLAAGALLLLLPVCAHNNVQSCVCCRYYFDGKPTETIVLHCPDGAPTSGDSWHVVENFPAGFSPPPGAHPTEWDGDGDRMGRHLTALKDGRVVLTWGQAHDPFGIW
jgi:hypothetical protein